MPVVDLSSGLTFNFIWQDLGISLSCFEDIMANQPSQIFGILYNIQHLYKWM